MYEHAAHKNNNRPAQDFEFTPQEEIANYMLGVRRDVASPSDIELFNDKLPGWQIETPRAEGHPYTEFSKILNWQRIDSQLMSIAGIICRQEGIKLSIEDEQIRLNTLGSNVYTKELARVAMVDFAVQPSRFGPERLETMARIIGNVSNKSKLNEILPKPFVLLDKSQKSKHLNVEGLTNADQETLGVVSKLWPRERQVLANIHLPLETIAGGLSATDSTVRTHIHNMSKKLGTKNIRDLLLLSIQSGISTITEEHVAELRAKDISEFTSREDDVFSCLVNGFEYKEIARHLGLSTSTVRTHMHHVYGKLEVDNKKDAILTALFNNIDIAPDLPPKG